MTTSGISKKQLKEFMPIPYNHGMVLHRIHRYHCGALLRMEKCRKRCNDCKERLVSSLGKIKGKHVREPYGLLVWVLRDAIADIAEQGEGRAEIRVNKLGEPLEGNLFELLLKEFNNVDLSNRS